MKVILASNSKQRQDILKMVGLKYDVMLSNIEESSTKKDPYEYVKELSLNKALNVSSRLKENAIIIGADTIVFKDNKIYEKPKSLEEAAQNIKEFSASKNTVITGITIIDKYNDKKISVATSTDVYFREVDSEEITWYINNESKIFKSCGYVPHGKAATFIERIEGDYNTILGLSPNVLFKTLKKLGYKVTDFDFE